MPIGIFSRMTGLSHRALRLYADRGLLPPAHVDETTGLPLLRRPLHPGGGDDPPAAPPRRAARRDAPVHRRGRDGPPRGDHHASRSSASSRSRRAWTPPCGCSAGSTSSTACSAPRRPSSSSTFPRSAACAGRARWPARSSTSPTSSSPPSWPAAPPRLGPRRRPAAKSSCCCDPTDKGLAGGDETVLRYELCLPVSGERRRRRPADLVELGGRPVRAQRLHRPLRGRLPVRVRASARVARRQRPRAARPAAHALHPRRARHGRPGRLRDGAHLAGDGDALPECRRSGRRTSRTAGCAVRPGEEANGRREELRPPGARAPSTRLGGAEPLR